MLEDKLLNRKTGILIYGITPPKLSHSHEKIVEISKKQLERIQKLDIDGLVIYDLQDEKERTDIERPFPFLETVDPMIYSSEYLRELQIPKIVYRCVGKYTEEELTKWITSATNEAIYSVFVGAASKNQVTTLSLSEAYKVYNEHSNNLILGGVAIPERHIMKKDEHLRVLRKIKSGCRFFVSQAAYNLTASKNFLSDYYYFCKENEIEMVPIIFTLTPCGSLKTMEFMKWLGIDVPQWIENELMHAEDILEESIKLTKGIFEELLIFAKEKGIPIGCNVESVSVRKVEIEASVRLVEDIHEMMENYR